MLSIKVLGSGCENCKKVEALARKVVSALSIDAQIVKITEHADIMQYKILSTPGLVVNEKVVCAGRIPNETEVTTWFVNAMEE
jgi:small redox-active disulfide protein 2